MAIGTDWGSGVVLQELGGRPEPGGWVRGAEDRRGRRREVPSSSTLQPAGAS